MCLGDPKNFMNAYEIIRIIRILMIPILRVQRRSKQMPRQLADFATPPESLGRLSSTSAYGSKLGAILKNALGEQQAWIDQNCEAIGTNDDDQIAAVLEPIRPRRLITEHVADTIPHGLLRSAQTWMHIYSRDGEPQRKTGKPKCHHRWTDGDFAHTEKCGRIP